MVSFDKVKSTRTQLWTGPRETDICIDYEDI